MKEKKKTKTTSYYTLVNIWLDEDNHYPEDINVTTGIFLTHLTATAASNALAKSISPPTYSFVIKNKHIYDCTLAKSHIIDYYRLEMIKSKTLVNKLITNAHKESNDQ